MPVPSLQLLIVKYLILSVEIWQESRKTNPLTIKPKNRRSETILDNMKRELNVDTKVTQNWKTATHSYMNIISNIRYGHTETSWITI